MSKNKTGRSASKILSIDEDRRADSVINAERPAGWWSNLRLGTRWLVVGIVALVSIGALGAGLKYLEDDAQWQKAIAQEDRSLLSKVNPFMPAIPPPPTPQLSREYLYAGSRLLAVEDANANAAPPADLAIWRPSTGTWWVLGGPGSAQTTQAWGLPTDIPVPGDYDGDGKTDFSVFRPSTGEWYVINSSNLAWSVWQWGLSTDILVPADYDGDGKTDRGVFRPSNANWYIIRSSDGAWFQPQFGLSTDTPAAVDYDGDGKADIGVWRGASPSTFYVLRSGNGQLQTAQLGQSGDVPVSADYDGDGKADFALRRGADWIILNSSNGQSQTVTWQQAGDKAVQNDYDGDGKVDIATWRDSNGTWYIRKSASGNSLRQQAWGQSGDIPVPAYYRR